MWHFGALESPAQGPVGVQGGRKTYTLEWEPVLPLGSSAEYVIGELSTSLLSRTTLSSELRILDLSQAVQWTPHLHPAL